MIPSLNVQNKFASFTSFLGQSFKQVLCRQPRSFNSSGTVGSELSQICLTLEQLSIAVSLLIIILIIKQCQNDRVLVQRKMLFRTCPKNLSSHVSFGSIWLKWSKNAHFGGHDYGSTDFGEGQYPKSLRLLGPGRPSAGRAQVDRRDADTSNGYTSEASLCAFAQSKTVPDGGA